MSHARFVTGAVLLAVAGGEEAPRLFAFGHAWAEHSVDGRWTVTDAAIRPPEHQANGKDLAQ